MSNDTEQSVYDDFAEAVQDIKEEHGGLPADIAHRVEALQDDSGTDLDASARQDAGGFSVYLECPKCEAPLARVTTQAKADRVKTQRGDELSRTRSHIIGVCPDCGRFKTAVQMVRLTGPVADVPYVKDPAWTWGYEGVDGDE